VTEKRHIWVGVRNFYVLLQLDAGSWPLPPNERHRSRCLVLNRTTHGTVCRHPHVRLEQSGGAKLRINVLCASTQGARERVRKPLSKPWLGR